MLFDLQSLKLWHQNKNSRVDTGADTIVHFNQTIFGKPDSVDSAIATLQRLNGQSHQVISAAVVLNTVSGEFYQNG